jgi:hypothetical protein
VPRLDCLFGGSPVLGLAGARTIESGAFDFWTVMTAMGPSIMLRHWEAAGGQPPGPGGLLRFLASDHYAALPTNRIPSQIIADITTDAWRPIQAGDSMDGQLLSVATTFCRSSTGRLTAS